MSTKTPLIAEAWEDALQHHPDRPICGIPVQTNRCGVIPKGHSGKWRVITDLSYPLGSSVNDSIDSTLCSLTYTSVEKVAQQVMSLGTGALMAKVDIKSAYRLIPVHPQDRHLLGMMWEDEVFIDPMLPFGLRSAPKIFTAVADALQWCLEQQGINLVDHYLDDYIVWGRPESTQCKLAPEFHISVPYISTHDNVLADDLSRNRLSSFFTKVPRADLRPTPVLPSLLSLLFNPDMDWVSPTWTRQFQDIISRV